MFATLTTSEICPGFRLNATASSCASPKCRRIGGITPYAAAMPGSTAFFAQECQPAVASQAESAGDFVDFRRHVRIGDLNSLLRAGVGNQLPVHHALQYFFAVAANALPAQLLPVDLLAVDDGHNLQR